MTEGDNQQPASPHDYQPNALDSRSLQTARTLTMFSSIAGPVSLFIGGVLLSGAGIVCGIIAWRKLKALGSRETEIAEAANQLKKSCVIALVFCAVAFVLNAISFAFSFSALLAMVESGELAELATEASSGAASTSTWG